MRHFMENTAYSRKVLKKKPIPRNFFFFYKAANNNAYDEDKSPCKISQMKVAFNNILLFGTQNPPGLYGGERPCHASKYRFIALHFSYKKKLFHLRDLVHWSNHYTHADKRLLEINSYN